MKVKLLRSVSEKRELRWRIHGIEGEVIIADNGSTDGSQEIAIREGARVVNVPIRGYGAALMAGIQAADSEYVLMGDSDDSYDFTHIPHFLKQLRAGSELVMGNRFRGGIADRAMPFLHRYFGNPALTRIGRLFFKSPCGDFYCGLRGFRKDSFLRMGIRSTGMEFAYRDGSEGEPAADKGQRDSNHAIS